MKLIFLVIALTFLSGCSSVCPKPEKTYLEKPEKTYLEKLEEEERAYIKGVIDKDKNLNKRQKFLKNEFMKCFRDLIKNPNTIQNIMEWQKNFLYNGVSNFCLTQLQKEHGDITEFLEVLH